MVKINTVENALLEMNGGEFHNLMDEYVRKKFNCRNLQSLGVQLGTNKSTKGTPDSYSKNEDGKYTLFMYSTVNTSSFEKLKDDIESCFNIDKVGLKKENIKKIFCVYSSTNLGIKKKEELENLKPGVSIELIGPDTISKDLKSKYPLLLQDYMGIPLGTDQIYSPKQFIKIHDKSRTNAPLDTKFKFREKELKILKGKLENDQVALISGAAGVGKTRLAMKACLDLELLDYDVFCIKSNGKELHNDIRRLVNEPGNYLLFIDDANTIEDLRAILSYLTQVDEGIYYKIIFTVRDYAVSNIKKLVEEYFNLFELKIERLKDREIEELLENELQIKNEYYKKRLRDISKGNPRLAILAGKYARKYPLKNLNNTTDIYKKYYGKIIDEKVLSETEISVLFSIAICGGRVSTKNHFLQEILKLLEIRVSEFLKTCKKLFKIELIDMLNDEAVSFPDESLKDYILFYKLLDTQEVSITKLIDIGFINHSKEVIDVINNLMNLFYTEKNADYIKSEVMHCWNNSDKKHEDKYLKAFHLFNEDKALESVMSNIEEMDYCVVDFKKVYEKNKDNLEINNLELDILKHFKNYENSIEAVDLLLIMTEKRSDLIAEIYHVFINHMLIDKHSYRDDYQRELRIINQVWNRYRQSKDDRIYFLLLKLIEYSLRYYYTYFEPENDDKWSIIQVKLINSKGIRKFRELLWSILKDLYDNNPNDVKILDLIGFNFEYGPIFDEKQSELFKRDLKCIEEKFVRHWTKPNIHQCIILFGLERLAEQLDIEISDSFKIYRREKEFQIYTILMRDSNIELSREEDEKVKQKLELFLNKFNGSDFFNLFTFLKEVEKQKINGNWLLHEGLVLIFEIIQSRDDIVQVIKNYLDAHAPFAELVSDLVFNILFKSMTIFDIEKIINKSILIHKRFWLYHMWRTLPDYQTTLEDSTKYMNFFKNELGMDNPFIHDFITISKFVKVRPNLLDEISSSLSKVSNSNNLIASFFGWITSEDKADRILDLFKNDIGKLENLYLKAIKSDRDFDSFGWLLFKLVDRNIEVWDYYLQSLFLGQSKNRFSSNIFKKVWKRSDYEQYMNKILDKMQNTNSWLSNPYLINSVFPSGLYENCQELWFLGLINKHSDDEKMMRVVFEIILMKFKDNQKMFYMQFIKQNKKLEKFKLLPFETSSVIVSGNGSFIPYLNNKIDFFSDLKSELLGIDYISHKQYLNEKIEYIRQTLKRVEINEYTDYWNN